MQPHAELGSSTIICAPCPERAVGKFICGQIKLENCLKQDPSLIQVKPTKDHGIEKVLISQNIKQTIDFFQNSAKALSTESAGFFLSRLGLSGNFSICSPSASPFFDQNTISDKSNELSLNRFFTASVNERNGVLYRYFILIFKYI